MGGVQKICTLETVPPFKIQKNTMPLFLIVLGASSVGAAIALYILRKYDPH
tara:strand:+ start:166 stop:318 length:153 start_codon:yes stop_codon:yes gene_type:complete